VGRVNTRKPVPDAGAGRMKRQAICLLPTRGAGLSEETK